MLVGGAAVLLNLTMLVMDVFVVAMLVAVELQPESRTHSQSTDNQQGDANEKFSPGRHGLDRGEVLETDRDQSQDNHSGRVACSPGQSAAAGRQRTVDGKRSHRH